MDTLGVQIHGCHGGMYSQSQTNKEVYLPWVSKNHKLAMQKCNQLFAEWVALG